MDRNLQNRKGHAAVINSKKAKRKRGIQAELVQLSSRIPQPLSPPRASLCAANSSRSGVASVNCAVRVSFLTAARMFCGLEMDLGGSDGLLCLISTCSQSTMLQDMRVAMRMACWGESWEAMLDAILSPAMAHFVSLLQVQSGTAGKLYTSRCSLHPSQAQASSSLS